MFRDLEEIQDKNDELEITVETIFKEAFIL
jgi:hypothetical protein